MAPHVRIVRAKGRVYYYHRPTGRRLPDPSDPTFWTAYAAAQAAGAEATRVCRSLADLVDAYRAAPEYTGLAARTRADYDFVLERLRATGEATPVTSITAADVLAARDAMFAKYKRRRANYAVQVLRILLSWSVPRGWRTDNPAAGVPLIRRPTRIVTTDGEEVRAPDVNRAWTPAEWRAVWDAAPLQLRTMLALGLWAGMRQQDAVRVTWTAVRNGRLQWTMSKNGVRRDVRIIGPLAAALDAAPRVAVQIATTGRGAPWTQSGFRASWRTLRARLEARGAVAPGLTYHGLRVTLASWLAERGLAAEALRNAIGDRSAAMGAHYARGARESALADLVADELEALHAEILAG